MINSGLMINYGIINERQYTCNAIKDLIILSMKKKSMECEYLFKNDNHCYQAAIFRYANPMVQKQRNRTMRTRQVSFIYAFLLLGFVSLTLVSCGGEDGDPGPAGTAGPPGTSGAAATTNPSDALTVEINSVSIGPPTVVSFTMTTNDGIPFTGFQASQGRFLIAQLVPGADGETDSWQNYINDTEVANGVGPGTVDQVQANAENNGELVDNGDGTYTYTFDTDVTNVTSPVAVPYDSSATHRVGIELRGLPAFNAFYDFQPSSGSIGGINSRTIVKIESCNACHGNLVLHGGGRIDTKECVMCHNPGSTDANSGNTIDFKVMIHKIHRGENLPSVVAGTDYIIYGHNDNPHNYSTVVFPQDVRNCTTCHDPADTDTPEAANIVNYPSRAACGACHDDVDFAAGVAGGHEGGVVSDDSECVTCHAVGEMAGGVLEGHAIDTKVAAAQFQYNIVDVSYTAPNVTVTLSVTDPTNADAPYVLETDPEFNSGGSSTLNLLVAWDTDDYNNEGSGGAPAEVISVALANASGNATPIGGGQYTVTVALPAEAQAAGSATVALEGHPAADPDGDMTYDVRVPVTSVVEYFAINDASPVSRRDVVDLAKCQVCHGVNDGLSLHGGNRTDNVQLCVMCHNPNATDIAQRPTDPDATVNQVNANATGGAEEQAIHFKYMIHAIHGASKRENDFIVYGYRNTPHDYAEVEFPRSPSDCDACHTSDGFELPLASGVLGTTIRTQGTVNVSNNFGTQDFLPSLAVVLDPNDDSNISPIAATCSACHDSVLAQAHMELNGGLFLDTQAVIDNNIETCAVCHGPERDADVAVVHGID